MPKLEERTEYIKELAKSNDSIGLSIEMMKDHPSLVKCSKNLYLFNGKCYDLITDDTVKEMFHAFCIEYGITNKWRLLGQVVESLFSYQGIPRVNKMNDHSNLVCVKNGIIDLNSRELIPHSPSYYFNSFADVDYDPNVTDCPHFTNYLNQTFNGDQDTISNIIRLGGYLLDSECRANKMFMFDGNGGNGKSVMIDTFSMFFTVSETNSQVTAISLSDLASDKFKKSDLIYSRFNQCAEEKKGYIDAEEIKKIISGDLINVRGLYRDTITFRPNCKLIVACNGLPKFTDTTNGIYRRLCLIRFKNYYIDEHEFAKVQHAKERRIFLKDPDLLDNIKLEKTAILNLFLDGLVSLRENKYQFIDSDDSRDAIEEFKTASDAVREFLNENYVIDFKGEEPIMNIYEHYKRWYGSNVSDSSVKLRSAEMGKRIKETFGIDSAGRKTVWNTVSNEYEKLTYYNLSRIKVEAPDDGFGDLSTAIEAEPTLFNQ
jgi:P4 family phage/plasmid primase-like protien